MTTEHTETINYRDASARDFVSTSPGPTSVHFRVLRGS
jgi:hypothetical protein